MAEWIFFDLDGTLTDPAEGITNSIIHALKYYGCDIPSYRELCTFIGPPLLDSFQEKCGFSPEKAAEAVVKYREYFGVKGLFENQVYPGIPEMLSALRKAGKRLVVATSKPEEYALRIVEHYGLAPYFENVCGSLMDESRSKKAEVIAYALERNGIADRNAVLMVGDRKHDVIGAAANSLKSCGVLYGYGSRDELTAAGADFIAEDIAALTDICLR